MLYLKLCTNEKENKKKKIMLAPKVNNSTSISWLKLLWLALAVRIHKGREGEQWIRQRV